MKRGSLSASLEIEANLSVFELTSIESLDDILGVLVGGELNDGRALGLASLVAHENDLHSANLVLLEEVLKRLLVKVEGKVAGKNFVDGPSRSRLHGLILSGSSLATACPRVRVGSALRGRAWGGVGHGGALLRV